MLFNFFKKKTTAIDCRDFSFLETDMHNHILPGIDDGSSSAEQSLFFIKELQQLGFSKFICTPHIYAEVYPNTGETIAASYDRLAKVAHLNSLPALPLSLAAEYMVDECLDRYIRQGNIKPLYENYVLVEFSYAVEPKNVEQSIFALQVAGYQPVIAHPERYAYFRKRNEKYEQLKDLGCAFQLNLLSMLGYYGNEIKEIAETLLKNKWYDFAGTDLHHHRHLAALKMMTQKKKLMNQLMHYPFRNKELQPQLQATISPVTNTTRKERLVNV
ncbi:MAG: histidinol phosphatase [Filimonas sp.]|nr:histidinol phosphatase [Filimonas sp.]